MRLRYLITEFSQVIHKELGIDPYDVAFDFLQRLLRADPNIFFYENRLGLEKKRSRAQHALPDIFYIVEGPPHGAGPVFGNPEYMELQLNRATMCDLLECNGSKDNAFKKIADNLHTRGEYLDFYSELAGSLKREDIEPTQWNTLHRVSASMALVLRYCHMSLGQIPKEIQIDFKAQYDGPKNRGRPKGKKAGAAEDIDHMLWLIDSDLHPLQVGGARMAAVQIKEIWDIERSINSIYQNILPKYDELLNKPKD